MKRPGHCTLCNEPVREIVSKHTEGPRKGDPKQLGKWFDNGYRVTFLLSDGSIADITLCKECLDGGIENIFDEIWKAVEERFLWEEDNLEVERTPFQQKQVEKELNRILSLKIEKEVGRRMWNYI